MLLRADTADTVGGTLNSVTSTLGGGSGTGRSSGEGEGEGVGEGEGLSNLELREGGGGGGARLVDAFKSDEDDDVRK